MDLFWPAEVSWEGQVTLLESGALRLLMNEEPLLSFFFLNLLGALLHSAPFFPSFEIVEF